MILPENRYRVMLYCLSMILSKNRYPLFPIMLYCLSMILSEYPLFRIMLYWLLNVEPFGSGSTASRCAWLFGQTT